MMLVGSFPFNGFLAGLLSSIGFFALTGGFTMRWDCIWTVRLRRLLIDPAVGMCVCLGDCCDATDAHAMER